MKAARTATVFAAVAVAVIAAFAYAAQSRKPAPATAAAADLQQIPHVTIVAKRLTPAEKSALAAEENLQAARARQAGPRA